MKIKDYIYTATLCLVLVLGACAQEPSKEQSGTLKPPGKEALGDEFQNYWNRSKEVNSNIGSWISQYPAEFLACQALTERECAEKLEEEKPFYKPPAAPNEFELAIQPSEMIANRVPNSIRKGFWKTFSVGRSRIADTRGRLEITVETEPGKLRRDVLFIKKDGEWKIFEIVDPGEAEAWAAIGDAGSMKVRTQL